jgi:hypothetical protein
MIQAQVWNIQELPGITPDIQTQLASLNIHTSQQLLQRGRTSGEQKQLASRLQIPLRYILKWIALADLSRVPSVGCQFCGLLLHTGITSVSQLAQSPPNNLYRNIRRLHVATLRRSDLCPGQAQVNTWVQEAKQLA